MKHNFNKAAVGLIVCVLLNSCATILGGRISASQQTKPKRGETKRQIKVGYFIADIICLAIPLAIDFGTGAIYKPSRGGTKKQGNDNP